MQEGHQGEEEHQQGRLWQPQPRTPRRHGASWNKHNSSFTMQEKKKKYIREKKNAWAETNVQ